MNNFDQFPNEGASETEASAQNQGRHKSRDAKLEALIKREADAKAAVRAAKEQRKADEKKDQKRLIRIVGQALLQNAARHPDFELMLKGVLQTAMKPGTGDYSFLKQKGWIS